MSLAIHSVLSMNYFLWTVSILRYGHHLGEGEGGDVYRQFGAGEAEGFWKINWKRFERKLSLPIAELCTNKSPWIENTTKNTVIAVTTADI
jgi:hypothetical protein